MSSPEIVGKPKQLEPEPARARAASTAEEPIAGFEIGTFRQSLADWYNTSRRDLPWRETRDPYAILVSEMMLQQTQVKTVIPYFLRFMESFPTPEALADAPEQLVLKTWQGLGYYRRARYLQIAARQIVAEFGGQFPRAQADIRSLHGVGIYTAAAIASIAFNMRWACVDGNVMRVLTRLLASDDDIAAASVRNRLQDQADVLIDPLHPGDHNQAMMELGATVCTPRKPACMACPVKDFCRTLRTGQDPESRPVKSKRTQPSRIEFESLFLFHGGHFLLAKRPAEGLMASMWELPAQAKTQWRPWSQWLDAPIHSVGRMEKPVQHKFTHLWASYRVSVFSTETLTKWRRSPLSYQDWRWFQIHDLAEVPITKVLQKLLPDLLPYLKGTPCPPKHSTLPGLPIIK